MKLSWKIYIVMIIIFICSVIIPLLLPNRDLVNQIAIIPGSFSLLGILYRLFLDEAKYKKELFIQHDQQTYSLGAASHMANVAFDKHILFCEEYIAAMNDIITALYTNGPTQEALKHASDLQMIKSKYILWLTPKIESELEPFEQALRKIGANAQYRTINDDSSKSMIHEMYEIYSEVLAIDKDNSKNRDEQVTVSAILSKLRGVLGIEEITKLRQKIINKIQL